MIRGCWDGTDTSRLAWARDYCRGFCRDDDQHVASGRQPRSTVKSLFLSLSIRRELPAFPYSLQLQSTFATWKFSLNIWLQCKSSNRHRVLTGILLNPSAPVVECLLIVRGPDERIPLRKINYTRRGWRRIFHIVRVESRGRGGRRKRENRQKHKNKAN